MLSLNPEGGKLVVEVRLAPGHNPGSVILYCEQLGVVFCGDVIFRESIGRTDLPGGDYDTLITSIHEQVLTFPETTTLLPGHGPESSGGYERLYNPYLA
jgi:glyoxylase-like metal-dependent hydrolase (beta-lactamase superfamily II)